MASLGSPMTITGFSIITPTLNAAEYINACIDSVRSQADVCVEHIIVDGGSTDNTIDISRSNHCRTFLLEGSSIYEAMNYGISHARYKIIGFLNADDMYATETTLLSISREYSTLGVDGIVYGNCIFTDSENRLVYRLLSPKQLNPSISMLRLFNISHPSWFVSSDTIKGLSCYDTSFRFVADCDFIIRAITNKVKFCYLDVDVARFRLRAESASRTLAASREKKDLFQQMNGTSLIALVTHWVLLGALLSKDIRYVFFKIKRLFFEI